MYKSTLSVLATTILIVGCSSSPQEKFIKQQEVTESKKINQIKETISSIPEWYVDYIQEDDNYIYAVGTALSSDPQASIDNAKTLAISDATRKVNALMTTQKSMLVKKDGDGNVSTTSKQIIDEYTGTQQISGNRLIQKKLIQEGSKFRAYVMVAVKKVQSTNADFKELDKSHSELIQRATP